MAKRTLAEIAEEYDAVCNDPLLLSVEKEQRCAELLEEGKPLAIELLRPLFDGIHSFIVSFHYELFSYIPPRKRRASKKRRGGAS